jgi:TonB-linked SusC/RagA family outer membrane protein
MYKKIFANVCRAYSCISPKLLLRMKLTIFIWMAALLHVSAAIHAQKINLEVKNVSLEDVLDQISVQSGYNFLYNSAMMKTAKPVSLSARNASFKEVLKVCFEGQPLTFLINGNTVVITKITAVPPPPPAPEPSGFTVTGKVSDASGQPLHGVSVRLKGTTTGTVTDAKGEYSLQLPDGSGVLIFSYVGFATQELPVNNSAHLNVLLKEQLSALNEVIVVGYGTQKRSDVTGAIASVSAQNIQDVPSSNVLSALEGQIAGVDIEKSGGDSHPSAVPSIVIRGSRSMQAGNGPLYVVDGIPYNGNILDLNPNDVMSMQVLKDASATAIYGSRGANGVILITTRRGKTGKVQISYSAYAGFTKPLSEYNMMNGPQFATMAKWAKINGNPGTYSGLDDPKFLTDGTFNAAEIPYLMSGQSVDWQKLIYKTGVTTDHELSLAGGSDNTQYALSAGYYDLTGIYSQQAFQRFSLKLSIDQKIGKYVRMGISSLNNVSITNDQSANPLEQALRASPLVGPYDSTGQLYGFIPGSSSQVWNPLANLVPGAVAEKDNRLGTFTTAYIEVSLAPGLKYRFNGGAELRPDIYGNFYASATTNNLGGLSTATNTSTWSYNYTAENLLTYDRTFAGKHHINFTGLYSLEENESQNNSFGYNNISADYLQYYNPSYGSSLTGSGAYQKWDILSYMGRINYGYEDKYLLTATMRSDGSSRLAPGNKYHVFPSAAVAWNMHNEAFLKGSGVISSLKIRASYGSVGNTAIDPYQTLGSLSPIVYNYGTTTTTGAYPSNVPNPNLTWEYTSTANVGVDFGLLKDRITGSVELYHEYTKNLLLPESLPATSGIQNPVLTNVGKTENKGIELAINTVNIQSGARGGFNWSTSFNISLNRGKIAALQSGVAENINNDWFVGHPLGTIYDYKRLGVWQNTHADTALAQSLGLTLTGSGSVIGTIKVADLNHDGKINANDETIIGSAQPLFQGGITNHLSYKNVDLTIVASYKVGGTITSSIFQGGDFINSLQGVYNNLNENYWTPANHENYWPKPTSASTSPAYSNLLGYYNASYLKIRSLSVGYTFPGGIASRISARSLRVYATASDPFILFSPYRNQFHGVDPETAGTLGLGTPATWEMQFGLNVSF